MIDSITSLWFSIQIKWQTIASELYDSTIWRAYLYLFILSKKKCNGFDTLSRLPIFQILNLDTLKFLFIRFIDSFSGDTDNDD